jgi:hypothetical protein
LLDIYWNILTMHGPINVKSPNNTSKWQMGFNSAFKGLIKEMQYLYRYTDNLITDVCRYRPSVRTDYRKCARVVI